MNLAARKPDFGVCDQLRLNPACYASVTSKNVAIKHVVIKHYQDKQLGCAEKFAPQSWPPIHLLRRIYQLDSTFYFLILKAKLRIRAMLFDETLIELSDTDIGFNRICCLTV